MNVPETLRHVMRQAGFSQRVLGDRLDVTKQCVGSWCRGNSAPSAEMFFAACRECGYGVSLTKLH